MVEECVVEVPLDDIANNPWQTRAVDSEHSDGLAADIRENGLYQYPVGRVVVESGEVLLVEKVRRLHECGDLFGGQYHLQIGVGHHRLAAYRQLAGEDARFSTFPVKIRHLTNEEMADLAMRENDERKDLSEIERARALQERKNSFGWSNAELGRRYGLSRTRVSNLLRLLELPARVQQAVQSHGISGRASSVLASAYGLPDMLQEAIEPDTLLDAALAGVSGNELRRRMRRRLREHTVSLSSNDTFPLDLPFDDLAEAGEVVSAHCLPPGSHRRACPLLVELGRGGTDKRCPRRSCRDTKVDAWRRQQSVGQDQDDAESASDVDPDDPSGPSGPNGPTTIDDDDIDAGATEASLEALFTDDHSLSGSSVTADDEQASSKEPALSVDEDIIEPAVDGLVEELAALNPKVLVLLYYKMQYGRPAEDINWTREQALQAIARKLIEYELPYDAEHNPSAALEAMSRLLRKSGAELPWESQQQEV